MSKTNRIENQNAGNPPRPGQRRAWSAALRASIALAMLAAACDADVIFTNYAATGDTNALPGSLVINGENPGQSVAQVFTPAQDYTLTSLSLALSSPNGTGSFTVAIMSANPTSGDPDTVLEQFDVTAVATTAQTVVPIVLNSVVKPTLAAGKAYWIAVVANTVTTFGYWQGNLKGEISTSSGPAQVDVSPASQGFGGPWAAGLVNGQPRGAFQVSGAPAANSTTPTISSLVPSTVPAGSPAFTLTIYGSGFLSNAVVQWSNVNLTTTFVSSVQLTALVPADLVAFVGTNAITVANPGSASSNISYFTTTAVPAVTIGSLSPSSAQVGGPNFTLTVTGANFATGAVVYFGSTPLTPASITATQIQVTVPANLIATAGTRNVTVVQTSGTSNVVPFSVSTTSTVTIGALSPSSAIVGGGNVTLLITGSNFTSDAVVHFGSSTLAPASVTATQIQVIVPSTLLAAVGTPSVTVAQASGTSNAVTFAITVDSTVALTAVAPSFTLAGSTDFTLLITGTNFTTDATVHFASATLTPFSTTPSKILVTIPASLVTSVGIANITVVQSSGTSNSLSMTVGLSPGQPLTIATGGVLRSGKVGVAYTASLIATGGAAPYTWTAVSSALPPGLILAADGTITGIPTSAGSVLFSATATDAASSSVSGSFLVNIASVDSGAAITTANVLPAGLVGAAYSQTLSASGGTPPYKWSLISGALPGGLSLSGTGVISGTPTTQETSSFKVQVIDKSLAVSSQSFTLTINPASIGAVRTGVLSQVASGGGWKTSLYFVNASASPVAVAVRFWDDNGAALTLPLDVSQVGGHQTLTDSVVNATIGANATLLIQSDAQSSVSATGWVELLTTGPITGFGVFHYTTSGGAESEATVPLETTFTPSFLLSYDLTDGFTAGVALSNLVTAQAATVTATAWDESGNLLGTVPITVPAGGHTSFLLSDKLPATTANRGIVEFSAPNNTYITGFGLRINPAGGLTLSPKLARP